MTFRIDITSDIYTLCHGPAHRGDDISGLAYVPTLPPTDPCFHGYVPDNATQVNDLPNLRFDLIGYAPWVNGNCSLQYLASAAADHANTKAMIFYTVVNGNKSAVMPDEDDPMWDIGFGGYEFPIYAINGAQGEVLMSKIATYSRNMTDVWESPALAQTYDVDDYARVYIKVDTGMYLDLSCRLLCKC